MSNIYLATSALIISVIVLMIFFIKKRENNIETTTFRKMIVINMIETITTLLIIGVLLTFNSDDALRTLNRVDTILIVMWFSLMFYYVYNVSTKNPNKDTMYKIYWTNGTIYFFSLFLDASVVNENGLLYANGPLTNLALLGAVAYIIPTIFILFFVRDKRVDLEYNRAIPLYFLVFLFIFVILIKIIVPEVNFISILLSLADIVILATIENPDLKSLKQLKISKIETDRANSVKNDYLSGMSHEIRTSVNTIFGFTEDLQKYKDVVPEEMVEDIENIKLESENLLDIVGHAINIDEMEASGLDVEEVVYNPKRVIESLVKIDITKIGAKPVEFNLSICDNLPYKLKGDRNRFREIVSNLLCNAIEYTDKGEIDLTVDCVNEDEMCNLMISVEDTGRGIETDKIQSLFNKFDYTYVDENDEQLGLALTKKMIKSLGGKINVQSKAGEGSIFVANIPQKIAQLENESTKEEKVDEPENNKNDDADALKKKRVLIVDDNKLNIKVAKLALKDFDFEIDECYDGKECLEKVVNGDEYDLILMDIMMLNMNGETAFAKLKENPNFHIPTIAVTADAAAGAKEKYLSEGFDDYIAKPFNRELIKERLDIIFKK